MSEPRIPITFSNEVPPGEDRERRVCQTCGFIDYTNPRIVTGVVAHSDGRILLCRRAIEPRKGFWTLPAGFMELGESVEEGARREAHEEARADLEIETLLGMYSIPRIGQVQIFFRARLMNDPSPGPESLEVAMFGWDEIPWKELAFPSVRWALDHYRETEGRTGFPPFGNPPGTDKLTRQPMIDGGIIEATLQAVADHHGDPTAKIYARLFAMNPELEALFHMDRDGGVRASMVQQGLECILDYVGPRLTAPQIISASRQHHEGYGVPDGRFDLFFVAMRDAFRDILGDEWSPAMETHWARLLEAFAAIR